MAEMPAIRVDKSTDYSNWSSEQLIERVLELEQKLEAQVSQIQPSETTMSTAAAAAAAAVTPSSRQVRKTKAVPKPFDPTKYSTRFIALKFAYLGGEYNGFEHHCGNTTPLPTIEEELWKALVTCRLIFPPSLKQHGLDVKIDGLDSLRPGRAPVDWDGCEYSKCGRTDRGVSAFGQVIGIRVRSAKKLAETRMSDMEDNEQNQRHEEQFDPIKDELPYIAILNRVLPPSIRMLAWCPAPPTNFSARFSCKERCYRYFFTSPAYLQVPGASNSTADGWLDIDAMRDAAALLVGSHDFRNMCKIDPTKQITNFTRRISHATIDFVADIPSPPSSFSASPRGSESRLGIYAFTVRGSAFLWHQVRCMVALLFLVGQGLEKPLVIRELLDVQRNPGKPKYEMANDRPLVLWDCMFSATHGKLDESSRPVVEHWNRGTGEDELVWLYAGDDGLASSTAVTSKWGRSGIMEDLWRNWRSTKMDEILAGQLFHLISEQDPRSLPMDGKRQELGQRVFAGDHHAPSKGKYLPVMQKEKMDPVEVINSKWAERKGLLETRSSPRK